jgi:hypothetical protein
MAKDEKRGRKNDKRENDEEVDQHAAPGADISNHFRCYFNHHPPDDDLVIGALGRSMVPAWDDTLKGGMI